MCCIDFTMEQRIDNQLKLSLTMTEQERIRTEDMNTGYDVETDEWELIIRYSGELSEQFYILAREIRELEGGYLLAYVKEQNIEAIGLLPEIIYVEKPRKLFLQNNSARNSICVKEELWTGQGVIVAIIDSGIDYMHPEFMSDSGSSRILAIYDESTRKEYMREEINRAIISRDARIPMDVGGHGTAVASIAAGSNIGIATGADIVCVKLGRDEFNNTARLMEGIDYCLSFDRPTAINISLGNNYGSHSGDSLLETYINDMALTKRCAICVGTGNYAAQNIHTSGKVSEEALVEELTIGMYESSVDIQIWKKYVDSMQLEIITPSGNIIAISSPGIGQITVGSNAIFYNYAVPSPYSLKQEIYIQISSNTGFIQNGLWQLRLIPIDITDGSYDMWLGNGKYISKDTGFVKNDSQTTLTIPSTAQRVISVGAYDYRRLNYADFSGRGYTREPVKLKPDLCAPGVNITVAQNGGGYNLRTGTSYATPHVTGAAALLMEWGIIKGNDLEMYGERLKAELIRKAKRIEPGVSYPNERTGWGFVCV